jgi:lysophospholipase L1-like esterase
MERISTLDRRSFRTVATTIVLGLILFCAGSTHSQIRIMPLGDSITKGVAGSSDSTGYRRALYLSLTGAGHSVNFVGSQANGHPTDFDRDHEGHGGYRADQIRDTISSWLTTNPADIILLHIGTNDISQGQTNSSTVSEVNEILDKIDAKSTATVVFLARIINRNDGQSLINKTRRYNDSLESLANRRIANGDLIFVVDQESALSYPADLADAVHPNDAGYGKMAQRWFTALSNYLTPLAVQLSSFTGKAVNQDDVRLEWTTLTETNCYGFEVYRMRGETGTWRKLGFIEGHGTTLTTHSYTYLDGSVGSGKYYYNIKQIDLDGKSETFPEVEVTVGVVPGKFVLAQNYPNPFNPSTKVEFSLPRSSYVTLKVFNLLGEEVAALAGQNFTAGSYRVDWNAKGVASGVYFYRLVAGAYVETKKMLLLR